MFLDDFFQPVINNVEVITLITSPTAYFCECVRARMCVL